MAGSSEYREAFRMGRPIKSRNAEGGRAVRVHSFPREGYRNAGTGSKTLPATTAAAAEPLGTFVKLFVPFQIELASANARLDPSKEQGGN